MVNALYRRLIKEPPMHLRSSLGFLLIGFSICRFAPAATYYVSPTGDDSADGTSTDHPWKSTDKVDSAKFQPGDTILFQRGGEWHGRLQPNSDGAQGQPITYDAYGTGNKPHIYGSDPLKNADFTPAGNNQYAIKIDTEADNALADHAFIPSTWANGTLTITTTTDPRTDGKTYTACTRGNVLFSNGKSHLVFRNLVIDETAGQINEGADQGYGIRIENSKDVLLDSCEAYRAGRHNIAVINSTEFVGKHLKAAYAMPNMPGDNTAYVSYSGAEANFDHCTSEWDDITADHMEDGKGGQYLTFVSHGDKQGLITMKNVTATNKISFMSGPVIVKGGTLKENASIENWGTGVLIDGVTLLDSSAIDQWASNGTIQNCIAHLTPTGGGPTGYGTAIVCRDKAKQNVIRFNTILAGKFSCLCLAGNDSATKWYGNIMVSDGTVIAKPPGDLTAGDVTSADYNFYFPSAAFAGKSLTDWKAMGFDAHSNNGDPQFADPDKNDYKLKPGSPCIKTAAVEAGDVPPTTFSGEKRNGTPADIGAE
jgi:hypothetical protein